MLGIVITIITLSATQTSNSFSDRKDVFSLPTTFSSFSSPDATEGGLSSCPSPKCKLLLLIINTTLMVGTGDIAWFSWFKLNLRIVCLWFRVKCLTSPALQSPWQPILSLTHLEAEVLCFLSLQGPEPNRFSCSSFFYSASPQNQCVPTWLLG